MPAMLVLKSSLRSGFTTHWRTLTFLIAGLALAAPLLALPARLVVANGQQPVPQNDQGEAMAEYQKMLQANPRSSLANYRIGDLLFDQRNYQASANRYRDALHGDGDPNWTKVWSHLQLGKIFDITNQRERAVLEYQRALETNDNTRNAITEAERLLQEPYKLPEAH
jgi:tetratricopeptide (TPR) repeat protein